VRIPPEKIDEVRQATDIVELIGGFVKLKKRGKNYLGLCPFHTEKTPSFNVSTDRQMYHCFGCGTGGNVFTFLMEQEKISFVEAVRTLAEKAGITLPTASPESEQAVSEQEQLFQICREAGLFFYHALTETTEGKLALEYFHNRGFSDETIRTFGLGYSPNTWDAYVTHAAAKKIPADLLLRAGLARRRDDGSLYDYFRGRAMFPVFSPTGRVIGFGARKLYETDPIAGKYINSPETPIYDKSRTLFGLFQVREALRESDFAILVEGYADLISLYQAGIRNVVASSGTALTREQILLVARYTKNITIVYDADSAGSKAALRGVDLILENDLDVRIARLPEGDDPDSYVRKAGAEEFRRRLTDAVSFIDFIAQAFEQEGKLATPEGQAQTVRTIVQSIARMRDELKRNFYVKHVAEKYKIYESILFRELERHVSTAKRERERDADRDRHARPLERPALPVPQHLPVPERDLLRAMFDGGGEMITYVLDAIGIESFSHPVARQIAEELQQATMEGEQTDPAAFMSRMENEAAKRLIAEVVFTKYALSRAWEEQGNAVEESDPRVRARHAIIAVRKQAIEAAQKENHRQLDEASKRGEDIEIYQQQNERLLKELKEVQKQ
jgi:DNA primase